MEILDMNEKVACNAKVGTNVDPRYPCYLQVISVNRVHLTTIVVDELVVLPFPHYLGNAHK